MCKKPGRHMLIASEQYVKYQEDCAPFLKEANIDYPVNIKALYYMPTRHSVDLCNLHEALCDVLVHHKVLKDDNSKIIVSMDGSRVLYDKERPRTEIYIVPVETPAP